MTEIDMDKEELLEKIMAIDHELRVIAESIMELEDSILIADMTWIYDEDNYLNQARKSVEKTGTITGELLTKLDPQYWWGYT